eukprot:jgi/Botrbrau1/7007/Bobra.0165s0036.1
MHLNLYDRRLRVALQDQLHSSMTTLWTALPTDVQSRILSFLSLPELAKVAATGKAFYEEYGRRCQADEAWLSQLAYSTFGQRLIYTLLEVFTFHLKNPRAKRCPCGALLQLKTPELSRRFHTGAYLHGLQISEGGPCPEARTLLELDDVILKASTCGLLLDPGLGSEVTWHLSFIKGARELRLWLGSDLLLRLRCRPEEAMEAYINRYIWLGDRYLALEISPLLAVVHLASKMAASLPLKTAVTRSRGRLYCSSCACEKLLGDSCDRHFLYGMSCKYGDVKWSDLGRFVRGHAPRGLSLLHMRHWRFGESLPDLTLYLALPRMAKRSRLSGEDDWRATHYWHWLRASLRTPQ